ncbi:MAG: hypothetical protein K0B15_07010 [Lentimicrobium sp.]|nr:hypothetical protein [Lentimicrobium sp.]
MDKPLISKDITIEDLAYHYPASTGFLLEKGLQCIICGEPVWGSLHELAQDKNLNDNQINDLITELNEFLKSK